MRRDSRTSGEVEKNLCYEIIQFKEKEVLNNFDEVANKIYY